MKHSGMNLPLLLLTVGAAATLVGCAPGNTQKQSDTQAAESSAALSDGTAGTAADGAASSAGSGSVLDGPAVYPEAYSITYEVTDEDGRVATLRKVRDADGNLYLQNGDEQSLYLWDGHTYHLYVSDSDGGFVPSEGTDTYTETYVEDASSFFDEYAEKGNNRFISGATEQDMETCLGRGCTVFTIGIGSDSNGMTCTFLVDNETGLCLSWRNEAQVGGYDVGGDSETLTCTEFTTADVPDLREWV